MFVDLDPLDHVKLAGIVASLHLDSCYVEKELKYCPTSKFLQLLLQPSMTPMPLYACDSLLIVLVM